MTPRVTLRRALHDPELLGTALAGPSWHTWRSILLAAMGEPLLPDELEAFQRFTGRAEAPTQLGTPAEASASSLVAGKLFLERGDYERRCCIVSFLRMSFEIVFNDFLNLPRPHSGGKANKGHSI
jgi:hypothetical protein